MGGVKMFGRVFVGGVVAAANMPADQADAQMDPTTTDFEAVFTALRAGCDLVNLIQMGTFFRDDLTRLR